MPKTRAMTQARPPSGASPDPLLQVQVPQGEWRTIPLSELHEDTHGATNRLAKTVRCVGQLMMIVVEECPDGSYVVRDGKRRVQTARAENKEAIEALVYRGLSEPEWALILAGLHNRSPNPVDEGRWFKTLRSGLSVQGIHANTGVDPATIKARLALVEHLPDDVLALIGGRTLKLGTAEQVSRLRGVFLDRAIAAIRAAAQAGTSFDGRALKHIRVARANTLGATLAAAAPPPPTLLPAEEILALEVKQLAERRGVPVTDLIAALGGQRAAEPAGLSVARTARVA